MCLLMKVFLWGFKTCWKKNWKHKYSKHPMFGPYKDVNTHTHTHFFQQRYNYIFCIKSECEGLSINDEWRNWEVKKRFVNCRCKAGNFHPLHLCVLRLHYQGRDWSLTSHNTLRITEFTWNWVNIWFHKIWNEWWIYRIFQKVLNKCLKE